MKGESFMTYNSKKNIASMIAGIFLIAAYVIYAMGSPPAPEDIQAWAKLMLVFVGIGVASQIVIQVIFHIALAIGIAVKEKAQGHEPDENVEKIMKSSMVEDERDKLINLKSSHIGYICAGSGFMIALFALAGGATFVIALHIIFGSCAAGTLIEGGAGICLHERGVRHGR